MRKRFLSKFLFLAGFLVAAVLWVVSAALPDGSYLFSEKYPFNFSWFALISCAGVFLCFLVRGFSGGIYKENRVPFKKFNFLLAGAVAVACVFLVVNIFALKSNLVVPIIVLIAVVAVVLGFLMTGGKKWDQADNQKPGYKTYAQREAEKEKEREGKK